MSPKYPLGNIYAGHTPGLLFILTNKNTLCRHISASCSPRNRVTFSWLRVSLAASVESEVKDSRMKDGARADAVTARSRGAADGGFPEPLILQSIERAEHFVPGSEAGHCGWHQRRHTGDVLALQGTSGMGLTKTDLHLDSPYKFKLAAALPSTASFVTTVFN